MTVGIFHMSFAVTEWLSRYKIPKGYEKNSRKESPG